MLLVVFMRDIIPDKDIDILGVRGMMNWMRRLGCGRWIIGVDITGMGKYD